MNNRNEWRSLISPVMIGAKLSPGPIPGEKIERNERGELRIAPDPRGAHRITRRGGQAKAPATLRLSAGLLGVPLKLRDYEAANWRVAVDGALIIALPVWALRKTRRTPDYESPQPISL